MSSNRVLTDAEWELLASLFPPREAKRGKPHAPWRPVANSILLVLRGKGKWSAIPDAPGYASKSVAHRWYLRFLKEGVLVRLLELAQGFGDTPEPIALPRRRNRLPKEEKEGENG